MSAVITSKTVHITTIMDRDRAREQMDGGEGGTSIQELADNIKQKGLIHPLAVTPIEPKGGEDTEYLLMAGGRRLAAMRLAGVHEVDVRIYPANLTKLERKQIELAENLFRKNLTWQEQSRITAEVHGLLVSTAEERTGEEGSWSKRDTAKFLGVSAGGLTQDVNLAEAIETVPEVAAAKNKTEARSIVSKIEEALIRAALAKKLSRKEAEGEVGRAQASLVEHYIIANTLEALPKLPSQSIDFVELDPPYGVDLTDQKKKHLYAGKDLAKYHEVKESDYPEFMLTVLRECYRVLKKDAFILCWYGPQWSEMIGELLDEIGFKRPVYPAIWVKNTGQCHYPSLHMGASYECFYYAYKGNPILSKQGRLNTFIYRGSPEKIHPTEKPIELMEDILSVFCYEGDRVLVPFLGSGSTLLAGANLHLDVFGYDLGENFKDAYTVRVYKSEPGRYQSYGEEK